MACMSNTTTHLLAEGNFGRYPAGKAPFSRRIGNLGERWAAMRAGRARFRTGLFDQNVAPAFNM
jgi:hypothetical protein